MTRTTNSVWLVYSKDSPTYNIIYFKLMMFGSEITDQYLWETAKDNYLSKIGALMDGEIKPNIVDARKYQKRYRNS